MYDAVGKASQNEVGLNLAPKVYSPSAQVSAFRVEGRIQEDGSVSGKWNSEAGTQGTFLATKQDSSSGAQPQTAISYQKRRGAIPCAVDSEVLRRVFRDLRAGSEQAARLEIARQAQEGALTGAAQPQTVAHHDQVRVAYSVIVIARGRAGEQKISLGPALLEEENLPKPVASVEFNIGDYYQLTQRQQAPNRARIVLDFMKPPPFDLSIPSLAPTPKNSSIEVVGNHSMWVSGVFEKLIRAFADN